MHPDPYRNTERPDYLAYFIAIVLLAAGGYGYVSGYTPQSWIAAIGEEFAFKYFAGF